VHESPNAAKYLHNRANVRDNGEGAFVPLLWYVCVGVSMKSSTNILSLSQAANLELFMSSFSKPQRSCAGADLRQWCGPDLVNKLDEGSPAWSG